LSDKEIADAPFYKPDPESEEIKYLLQRRYELGGFIPTRNQKAEALPMPPDKIFNEFNQDSGDRDVATTMVAVHVLSKLLKDKEIGQYIVPIVPDESRTFGMDALFRQVGIYSHVGQLYEPVDKESLLYYKESKNGSILEEGISEAGSISSFIAAGTAYSNHGVNMIPMFVYYSMFGFQRIGDFIWAAADARARGFMIGGTAGRTTLSGEGLQHCDGHSHVLALPVPNLKAYDPAFDYEVAVIIKEGIRRMYVNQEDLLYYITVMNEKYSMPAMPEGAEEGIIKGMYKFRGCDCENDKRKVHLLGSGTIFIEVMKASEILKDQFNISADIWSVTGYKQLYDDAREVVRLNRLNPDNVKKSYVEECFENEKGVFVAASDYMKVLPLSIANWIPGKLTVLGTDGFGRSDSRDAMRDYFEVDAKHIAWAAIYSLYEEGNIDKDELKKASQELGINPKKDNPAQY